MPSIRTSASLPRMAVGLLAAFALAASACAAESDQAPPPTSAIADVYYDDIYLGPSAGVNATPPQPAPAGNLIVNPSFEDGPEPWISLDTPAWGTPFSVSPAQANTGESSALLELRSEQGVSTRVFGVVQELAPQELPEVLSGSYYVDRWAKGTSKQYLQAVIIVFAAENIPPEVASATNHQIRYVLAGAEEQPITVSNARYVFDTRAEPEVGRWVNFEFNIRDDFQELWGEVPKRFAKLRLLFEVRWDEAEF